MKGISLWAIGLTLVLGSSSLDSSSMAFAHPYIEGDRLFMENRVGRELLVGKFLGEPRVEEGDIVVRQRLGAPGVVAVAFLGQKAACMITLSSGEKSWGRTWGGVPKSLVKRLGGFAGSFGRTCSGWIWKGTHGFFALVVSEDAGEYQRAQIVPHAGSPVAIEELHDENIPGPASATGLEVFELLLAEKPKRLLKVRGLRASYEISGGAFQFLILDLESGQVSKWRICTPREIESRAAYERNPVLQNLVGASGVDLARSSVPADRDSGHRLDWSAYLLCERI